MPGGWRRPHWSREVYLRRLILVHHGRLRVARRNEDGLYAIKHLRGRLAAKRFLKDFIYKPAAMLRLRALLGDVGLIQTPGKPLDLKTLPALELIDQLARHIAAERILVVEQIDRLNAPSIFDDRKDAPPPRTDPTPPPPKKKLSWIEIEVIEDATEQACNSVRIAVRTPDGNEAFYTTNSAGLIRIDEIEEGTCDARCETKGAKRANTLRFIKKGAKTGKKSDKKPEPLKPGTYHIRNVDNHQARTGETLDSLAKAAGLSKSELTQFNWDTDDPAKVNECLAGDVGCTKTGEDGNFLLDSSDKPGIVRIPGKWSEEGLATGQRHTFRVERIPPMRQLVRKEWVIELEGLNFHFDSAVLLPDYKTDDPDPAMPAEERVTTLCVLAEALREARRKPDRKLLITGHTDTSGSDAYNLPLSQQRADCALAALMGDRTKFVQIASAKHKVEDYQLILKWVARDWGWPCDPGLIDNQQGSKTSAATKAFQKQYNIEFGKSISEDGVVGEQTWGAFFDVYMKELMELTDCDDEAALNALRGNIKFVDDSKKAVGCGENFPKENRGLDGWRSLENRRVEIIFFAPDQLPSLSCHSGGTCKSAVCQVNNPKLFVPEMIPVPPVLPRRLRLRLHLQLAWADPNKAEHFFPEACPVYLVFGDGRDPIKKELEADGIIDTFIDRRAVSVSLLFDFTDSGANIGTQYLATGPADANPRETLVKADDIKAAVDKKNRLWRLPEKWSTNETDWTATDAPTYDKGKFAKLDDPATRIGTHAKPAKLLLDPHWKGIRLEFFDRSFGHSDHNHKRICIPPVMLEGFRMDPGKDDKRAPDSHSNWTVSDDDNAKTALCLPWVLRRKADGSADLPKLDKTMLIRLRADKQYIFSKSATEREIKTLEPAAEELKPRAERLQYYDLPKVWKSTRYYLRAADGTGKFFDTVTDADIAAADDLTKPLIFSLDDIVLSIPDASEKLTPLTLGASDRAAIFASTFDDTGPGQAASKVGVYKADSANRRSFFSNVDVASKNYIHDYPDWTRLIIAQGNLFDVFDRRTPEDDNNPVAGARAAVRWVDAPPLKAAGNVFNPRPARTDKTFFSLRPFHEQEYADRGQQYNGTAFGTTGRYEMALIRCCGRDGDTELMASLQYFRLFFSFNPAAPAPPPPPPQSIYHAPAPNWQTNREQYMEDCCKNIIERWNGNDAFNGERGQIIPRADTDKLRSTVIFFIQPAPSAATAHYSMDIVQPGMGQLGGRAWMNGSVGTGELGETDQTSLASGWFPAAHEVGHANGLPDEYNERWGARSFDELSIKYNTPGDAYEPDGRNETATAADCGMMNGNRLSRNRYFWHSAEFARAVTGKRFKVKYTNNYTDFWVPPHPNWPIRGYVWWPIAARPAATNGRAAYDLFLYTLGKDRYSQDLLHAGKGPFDGILLINVKMRVTMYSNTTNNIQLIASRLSAGVRAAFNGRFAATGTVQQGTDQEWTFTRCAIQVAPRFCIFYNTAKPAPTDASGNPINMAAHNAAATGLVNTYGAPFNVNIVETNNPNTRWNAASPDRNLTLEFSAQPFPAPPAAGQPWNVQLTENFNRKFCAMLGLAEDPAAITANDLLPLVQTLIPTNAAVNAI